MGGSRLRQIVATAAGMALAGAAGAADLRVRVEGVRSDRGRILVAVCSAESFLAPTCERTGAAPARTGTTELVVTDIPPGIYAVQAIHDENGNGSVDRNLLGLPREGLGFSRDAPMRMGPPRFSDAAIDLRGTGGTLSFTMRYF